MKKSREFLKIHTVFKAYFVFCAEMRRILLIFLLATATHQIYCQPEAILNDSISLKADRFVGVDNFGALYFSNENILYKKWNNQKWQFGDFILGELTSVSILNPLKILLFYESSNTIVFIDKYFNEISRIDFNTLQNFKNLSKVTPANDTQVWIFDNNTQQLEIFDTTANKSLAATQPLPDIPVAQDGNFNFCWLLSSNYISQFNIYGSLTYRFSNENFTSLQMYKKGILLQKENDLFYWNSASEKIVKIILPEITVEQFYVTNEILYIYDKKTIYSFNLSLKKN